MPPPAKRYNSRAMLALDSGLSPLLARARPCLPPALLILALSALFAFGGDRGYFYRPWVYSENSAKNLALAENLSPRDNFRLFRAVILAEDGSRYYDMYSRFPIGGTALIKLATAPFDGLSAKLTAARTLALLMFCGAALLAHLAVARLTASRRIGLAAALIAFSSYYALYHSDAVSNETMDIFGVMLTFHGMVVFVQDGRFRQLPIKACAALFVGWHVYALLLPFIVFGLAREIVALTRRRADSANGATARNIREKTGAGRKRHISTFAALIRSRYMILGAATLAFGIVVLGANLVNEYYAYGGETPPAELPTARSALARAGAPEAERLDLPSFARQQLYRVGGAALPYALPWKRGYPEPLQPPPAGVAVGVLALGAALAGIAFARRHRALWATLALFGFFWALLARGNVSFVHHVHEALYYVGVPLALFGLALMGARRLWGERAPIAAALAAVVVFAVSAFQMSGLDRDVQKAEAMKAEMADFDAIREKTRGEAVAVLTGHGYFDGWLRYNRAPYYLAGSVLPPIGYNPTSPRMDGVKYVVSDRADYEWGYPLTPENRVAFLYEVELFNLPPSELRRLESTEPTARADFDLYLEGDTLTYLKSPCAEDDARGRFFLSVHPIDAADLPQDRREMGHDSLNFEFAPQGIITDGKCAIRRLLPRYPIASISTGRYIPGEREIWSAEIRIAPQDETAARHESVYQAAKSGDLIIRSDFDIYLEGDTLTYLKSPCAESDTRGRFFLSVHPLDAADLPENRRALGHDALNFDFAPDGIIFADKCMIRRELPDYPIKKIETGKWIPGVGSLWAGEAAVGD